MTTDQSKPPNPATEPERRNAQGAHEGAPHEPDEFEPQDQSRSGDGRPATDRPVKPGGRKPDTAMCENRRHPGMIDKNEDC